MVIFKKTSSKSGFTLIELMVVVSITSVIATMSLPTFREFKYKAAQTEAKVNLKYVYTLVESYKSEVERQMNFASECSSTATSGAHIYCNLVVPTNTTCNKPNPFGYSHTDCAKSRYELSVIQMTGFPDSWRVHNFMKTNAIGTHARGIDGWEINRCHVICQSYRVTDLRTFSREYILPQCGDNGGVAINYFLGSNCSQ